MLIRLFVNRIYLYDDHLTTTFNTGEDTVEINDRLLTELEENSDKERLLFKGKDGPPRIISTGRAVRRALAFCFKGICIKRSGTDICSEHYFL